MIEGTIMKASRAAAKIPVHVFASCASPLMAQDAKGSLADGKALQIVRKEVQSLPSDILRG